LVPEIEKSDFLMLRSVFTEFEGFTASVVEESITNYLMYLFLIKDMLLR